MLRTQPGEGPWGREGKGEGLFPLTGWALCSLGGEAASEGRPEGGGPQKGFLFSFPQAHTASSPVVCRRVHLVSV